MPEFTIRFLIALLPFNFLQWNWPKQYFEHATLFIPFQKIILTSESLQLQDDCQQEYLEIVDGDLSLGRYVEVTRSVHTEPQHCR